MASAVTARRITHLLVLDFEATCGLINGVDIKAAAGNQEIIEFPTILYNLDTRTVEGTFHEYIRPVHLPKLTEFCTKLTGIEQSTVDAGDEFPAVWKRFEAFMRQHNLLSSERPYAFVTCGHWDLATMLPAQLAMSTRLDPSFALSPDGLQLSHFAARINIKVAFAKNKGLRSRQGLGLPTMLRKSNMQLEGRHHSGIDDCKNILRIAEHLQNRNWKPTTADFER